MGKAEKLREWRSKNPEKVTLHLQTYYQKNRERLLAYSREYREKNPEKIREINRRAKDSIPPEKRESQLAQKRVATMLRRYGLTPEDYETLLAAQNGCCAICSRTADQERYKRLNVDHCHGTGKVRGLLCTPCNHAIGVLGDTAEHFKRAVAYLER